MATFRILDQAPQYLLPDGSLNDGGKLWFYETDLSTLKNTWADPDKTTLNANPVTLDASGRSLTDIWGDGEYGVVLKTAAGVTLWTRNNVEIAGGDAAAIPALQNGMFLTNDGSILLWADIIQVPDPSGLANHYLVSDGSGIPLWQQIPEPPEPPAPEYEITTTYLKVGTLMILWGSGTAPAAPSAKSSSVNITFTTPFTSTPYSAVAQITNAGGSTPSGAICTHAITNLNTTGMTVTVNMPDDDTNSSWKLANSTPFSFLVIGLNIAD